MGLLKKLGILFGAATIVALTISPISYEEGMRKAKEYNRLEMQTYGQVFNEVTRETYGILLSENFKNYNLKLQKRLDRLNREFAF